MGMSADQRSKFAAFHRQWCRLHMSEKFSSGTKSHKQTNEETNKQTSRLNILSWFLVHVCNLMKW